MIKKTGIVLLMAFLLTSCKPPLTIKPNTFGGGQYDSARCILKTRDGYALAGMTMTYGLGHVDVYWMKINKRGRLIKQNSYGGKDDDRGFAMAGLPDAGFFIAGYTNSYGAGNKDVYLVKTDKNGQSMGGKVFGGPGLDEGKSICAAGGNAYLIAGNTTSFGKGNFDVYLIKVDMDGNCLWAKTYGGAGIDMANSVIPAGNDMYLVSGASSSKTKALTDFYVLMIDGNGGIIWEKTYPGEGADNALCAAQTGDGNFVIAGEKGSVQSASDTEILKIDPDGNTVWSRVYGGLMADSPARIIETADKGLMIAGTTESSGNGSSDMWLVRMDMLGMKKWEKTFGGREDEYAAGVVQEDDGGYIVAGWTRTFGAGDYDVYFLKTDENGDIR